jgi:hypothetical protein
MTTYSVFPQTYRMIAPARAALKTPRGVVHDSTANGGFVDVGRHDANLLGANGWFLIAPSGPTAARPQAGAAADLPNHAIELRAGERFYDTTLARMVYWNPALKAWVDETNTVR